MPDFKREYSKYRHRLRVNKSEAKLKAQDPEGFRDNQNQRIKKSEAKRCGNSYSPTTSKPVRDFYGGCG